MGQRLVVAAILVALSALGCETPAPACPPGMADNRPRTARLLALLKSTADGHKLLREPPRRYRVCYGQGQREAGVTALRQLLLPTATSDPVAAAKIAHLLTHLQLGQPFDPRSSAPCGPRLARARQLEQHAHALENRIRAALGAPPLPPSSVDSLMHQYAARCADGPSR